MLPLISLAVGSSPTRLSSLGHPMIDESNLPYAQQSLIFRLRKRAEIRRGISSRKSVQEGAPDRLADLLDEAANELSRLSNDNPDINRDIG